MRLEFAALGVGFFILPLIIGGGLLFNRMRSDRRLVNRFAALHRPARALVVEDVVPTESLRSIAIRIVSGIGDWVLRVGLLSGRTRDDVEATLRGAGHTGPAALRLFIGTKLLLVGILPASAWVAIDDMNIAFSTKVICIAAAAIMGMVGPDMVVRKRRDNHTKRIRDQIPDALDMMVICAGAGLGLGTTIVRVAHELQHSHPAIALELAHTANELQMMTDSKIPLTNLGTRCGVESAKRLATTLLQSAQYGTPLTDALRALAAELRTELITRFEAKAARMPVLLTLPMVAFILPCVFLVIGGPAVIKVIHALS
ncbi:type II secretion system F family protein [Acidisphaera sp. S103]|uniref:type II secretion system F family protein n=1 Tax=Acidisphaera sp. S103 TaxID=1747223 RepID=UPI00131C8895|nr:type II secretion system F family protein [Acidisphaera sp. S103]